MDAATPRVDRLLASCLSLAASGLVLLGVLAHAVEEGIVPVPELVRREGQRACVEATLVHLRITSFGSTRFILEEGNATVAGRTSVPWDAAPGDRARVCGTVHRSGAGIEIWTERAEDVRIVATWDEFEVSLTSLSFRPWDHRDRLVVVRGQFEPEGQRLFLVDETSGARVRASTQGHVPLGQPVRVEGRFSYEPDEGQFRLHVDHFRILE